MGPFARLPIRVRLTLVFALAMAVVLAATGLFVYLRVAAQLDASLDRRLAERAEDLGALGSSADAAGRLDGLAQVLAADGAVTESTPEMGAEPLLTPAEVRRASAGELIVERRVPSSDDPVRLRATSLGAADGVLVVGGSLEPKDETLEGLLTVFFIGGPIALLLASLAGYALAAAALAPVESMRRGADVVSASEPGRRLPLPPARDEIAALGTTLNAMLERLEWALERERRFVADASHELRTPLAALRTELELALRRERTAAELEDAVRSASDEAERLWRLAEDLLVLARTDAGQLPVRRDQLSAAELLAGVRERYAQRAAEAGRAIVVDGQPGLELSGDRLRLEQALGNLVENALRHGKGRISLSARRRDGCVELGVADEGQGFPAGFLGRAFEPFSRGDPARSAPGAGLGLAIVDAIARAHGGAARVASSSGGARAWIELP